MEKILQSQIVDVLFLGGEQQILSILDLPFDLWMSILPYVDPQSCRSLATACKDLHDAAGQYYGDWSFGRIIRYNRRRAQNIPKALAKNHMGVLALKEMSQLFAYFTPSAFIDDLIREFDALGVRPEEAFPLLKCVDLEFCHQLSIPEFARLAPYLSSTRSLNLSDAGLIRNHWLAQRDTLKSIFAGMPHLRTLSLSSTVQIYSQSIDAAIFLLQDVAPQLYELRMSYCDFRDKHFKKFFEALSFKNLESLYLRHNYWLTQECLSVLINALGPATLGPNLRLKFISLRNARITIDDTAEIKRVFPGIEIDLGIQASAAASTVHNLLLARFQAQNL